MSNLISRIYTWVTDKTNSLYITASRQDAELDQLVAACNQKVLCSSSAPGSPIAGQTWVDTTNKVLKVYRNNEWVIMGAVHISTTGNVMATPQEGDLWYDTTLNVLKAYNGATWDTVSFGLVINTKDEKTTLVDADMFLIEDSAAGNAQKKVLFSTLFSYAKKLKVGSLTRDMAAVSGDVAYTGVGFTPKAIIFFCATNISNADIWSGGVSDGSTHGAAYGINNGGDCNISTTKCIVAADDDLTKSQTAIIKTLDVDGFTLTWTKAGSPTGTATVVYLAIG